ncbi:hypothetical protein DIE04_18825 [Burkholderia sp. Bp8994]|nr:hypothetical protein DIE20_04460 [Burkholderia sp. Bp9131]RQR77593.1 hypothetical protein DIE12_04790 [Burkholderia sp. Bp9015]RQR94512.1 hypothetical protein DIE04_18825 [Burkholderia sp. Bp8994]RQS32878.1 hypothetical protein DIE05_04845 [Burkholderia sp. Bp8995]RQS36065.1 hypothetical protein DIE01_25465 [Burkholderia sp. Bp8990]RQS49942.1 hypothetical protein DIE00_06555 [Burkholderia sp. Bp8989]RQS63888.1 hypothetical protein DID98_03140 [Burkholderia sp. Bp8984]RQZ49025.1 hypothetic
MNRCRRREKTRRAAPGGPLHGPRAYHIETVKRSIRRRALCGARASAILPPCASARRPGRTPKTASTPGNRARAFERTQAPGRAANQRSNGFATARKG